MNCKDCIHYGICLWTQVNVKHKTLCEKFKNRANFAEVVRCKDCKYKSFEEANGTVHCCIDEFVRDRRKPEDFCSRGERK